MLDITNFWDASVGVWEEIDDIPEGFTMFAGGGKQTSEYYTNVEKTHVVRLSDHWGSGIRECNWYLKGYKRRNSFHWREVVDEAYPNIRPLLRERHRIGIIRISNLVDIRI